MVNSTSGETAGRPARAAVYIRVSSADQVDNFSLEAQEQAARQYVEAHGWDLHRVYADEGHSARTTNRPAFQMMLRDAQLRQFNVILVHKLDRLFRNLGNLLECVQALDRREVRLVSVSEDIDFSSASGRMLLTNLGMISEFYSNNLREETIKGKRQRALNGLWNSCIPFGYQKGECLACSSPPSHRAVPQRREVWHLSQPADGPPSTRQRWRARGVRAARVGQELSAGCHLSEPVRLSPDGAG